MWKLIQRIFWIGGGILFTGIFLLVVVNGFKSKPSETTLALTQEPINPYADKDNLFLAIAALDIPDMQDRLGEAQKRIRLQTEFNEIHASEHYPKPPVLAFHKLFETCDPAKQPCLATFAQEHNAIVQSIQDNATLLQRYLELPTFVGSYNTTPPSLYAPTFLSATRDVRLLFLAHVGDKFLHGSPVERTTALRQLCDDIGVWKKTLAGHSTLISSMVATAYLHQSWALMGEIINHPKFVVAQDGLVLEAALQALDMPDFSSMWGHEFRFSYQTMQNLNPHTLSAYSQADTDINDAPSTVQTIKNHVLLWFYDAADTQNRSAVYFNQIIAASKLPPAQALPALETISAQGDTLFEHPWTLYRNPLGQIIFAIMTPPYAAYNQRIYDVFAYQQMVLLSYQWRSQGLSPAAIEAQLQTSAPLHSHPASAAPFHYDPTRRTLRMTPLQARKDRRYDITIYAPSS